MQNLIMANLDKKQYVRLRAFAAGTGAGCCPRLLEQRHWLYAAGVLLGSEGRADYLSHGCVHFGSWAGDRVVVLRGGDRASEAFLPEELQALKGMGARDVGTAYAVLSSDYEDVSDDAIELMTKYASPEPGKDFLFEEWMLRPSDYRWLTPEALPAYLDKAIWGGKAGLNRFREWMLGLPELRDDVRALVERVRYGGYLEWRLAPEEKKQEDIDHDI